MPPTRKDFDMRVMRLQEQVARTRAVDLSLLHSAAVKAEQLTGHAAWDSYLQQIQARIENTEAELTAWDERMKRAFNEQDMRLAQINWHAAKARLDTLQEVIDLPHNVMQTARKELTKE